MAAGTSPLEPGRRAAGSAGRANARFRPARLVSWEGFYSLILALFVLSAARNAAKWVIHPFDPLRRWEYVASLYFINYDHGFVRRGLPGAILSLVSDTSYRDGQILLWCLVVCGALATVSLAWLAARCASGTRDRYLLAIICFVSPLSFALGLSDPGRYDPIGLLCVVAIVLLGVRAPGPYRTVVILSVATVAATLTEEFLFFFMLPLIASVACARGRAHTDQGRVSVFAVPSLVGAAFALWSLRARPSASVVHAVHRKLGVPDTRRDAAAILRWSIRDELRYVRSYGLGNVVFTGAVYFAIFVLLVVVLALLARRSDRAYWLSAMYCAAVAVTLSVVGVDATRWWSFAFATHLAATIIASGRGEPGRTRLSGASRAPQVNPLRGTLALNAALACAALATVFAPTVVQSTTIIRPSATGRLISSGHFWGVELPSSWIPGFAPALRKLRR